jgi:hypothetical protein
VGESSTLVKRHQRKGGRALVRDEVRSFDVPNIIWERAGGAAGSAV